MRKMFKMSAKLHVLLLVSTYLVCFTTVTNANDTFKKCCEKGTNWANEGFKCSKFPKPVVGVKEDKQTLCLQSIGYCCTRAQRDKECNDGKDAARTQQSCTVSRDAGGDYFRDCCEACKIGLSIKASGGTCDSDGFISCCEDPTTTTQSTTTQSKSTQSTSSQPTSSQPTSSQPTSSQATSSQPTSSQPTSTQSKSTSPTTEATTLSSKTAQTTPLGKNKITPPPLPELDSLCDEHGLELCAHNCVPTPGSYRCECRRGFVLMSDGKSCQQKDVTDRCKINNPCQQRCQDTGVAVRCNCYGGYKLNPDKKTCQDINECTEGLATCDPPYVCVNEPGSYYCADSELSEENEFEDNEFAEDIDNSNKCPIGYQYNYETKTCDDYDECFWKTYECANNKKCENTIGSYACVVEDDKKDPIECPKGYHYKASIEACTDVDECASGLDGCNKDSQICINTHGGFTCVERASKIKCIAGFKLSPLGVCEDIDECLENLCNENEKCINEEGGYRCLADNNTNNLIKPSSTTTTTTTAPTSHSTVTRPQYSPTTRFIPPRFDPYYTTPSTTTTTTESRLTSEIEPSYYQSPRDPYYPTPRTTTERYPPPPRPNEKTEPSYYPQPINPYEPKQDVPNSQSSCQPGHRFIASTNTCVDINECEEDGQSCDSSQDCLNTIGGFQCRCKTGFRLDSITGACVDINECQYNSHDCEIYQRCDNTIGSYQCSRILSCGTGYTLNAANGLCEDDDECLLGTHDCRILGPNFQCRNTLGSFRCEKKRCTQNCNQGKTIYNNPTLIYKPSNPNSHLRPVTSVHIKSCLPGFLKNTYGECDDIDECRSSPCKKQQRCLNTIGSYKCVNLIHCPPGYKINENATDCQDIDECETGTHKCTGYQKCVNRPGYHICQCPIGTTPNNQNQCEDIDECKINEIFQVCPRYSDCENTMGSYKCRCKDGFRDAGDGKTCDDVDECTDQPGLCHQTCINTWGSYRCSCNPGFILNSDNRTCTDIDECEEFKDKNLCIGFCKNTPGSYACGCPEGFKLGSNGRTCLDIDECERGNICQNPNENCWNIRGGYRCNRIQCPPNYVLDPAHKSRCKRAVNYCHSSDKACLQMPSTYSYHYINFPSSLPLPHTGYIELFTLRGPQTQKINAIFNMKIMDVRCPYSIMKANQDFFKMHRSNYNEALLLLSRMIEGPQEVDIEMTMEIYHNGEYKGSVVANILILVSQYEF